MTVTVDLIETGALALQSMAEAARQNALLVSYRSARLAGHSHMGGVPIRDLEVESLVTQQRLFRMLDDLLPDLIASGGAA